MNDGIIQNFCFVGVILASALCLGGLILLIVAVVRGVCQSAYNTRDNAYLFIGGGLLCYGATIASVLMGRIAGLDLCAIMLLGSLFGFFGVSKWLNL